MQAARRHGHLSNMQARRSTALSWTSSLALVWSLGQDIREESTTPTTEPLCRGRWNKFPGDPRTFKNRQQNRAREANEGKGAPNKGRVQHVARPTINCPAFSVSSSQVTHVRYRIRTTHQLWSHSFVMFFRPAASRHDARSPRSTSSSVIPQETSILTQYGINTKHRRQAKSCLLTVWWHCPTSVLERIEMRCPMLHRFRVSSTH